MLSLSGLSSQETAKKGNLYGIAGMGLAIVATMMAIENVGRSSMALAASVGIAVGIVLALKVAMTQMPQLVRYSTRSWDWRQLWLPWPVSSAAP